MPSYKPAPERYPFGNWLGEQGQFIDTIEGAEGGVWPAELQEVDYYTRAGTGNLGAGDLDDAHAEHKRTDFLTLRDFSLSTLGLLTDLAGCYKYWIALTDCDGFRIDTLKHVSLEQARNFCGTIKEFSSNVGNERRHGLRGDSRRQAVRGPRAGQPAGSRRGQGLERALGTRPQLIQHSPPEEMLARVPP